MLQGGAPCVSDAYLAYFERFISEQQLSDVFLFDPCENNNYCGFDKIKVARHMSPAILVADILEEIEQAVRVVGAPGTVDRSSAAVGRGSSTGPFRSLNSNPNCPVSSISWRRCPAPAIHWLARAWS